MMYKRSAVHCCRCLASGLLLLAANEGLNVAVGLGGQPHGSGDVEVHDCVSRMQQACNRADLVSSAELFISASIQQRLRLQLIRAVCIRASPVKARPTASVLPPASGVTPQARRLSHAGCADVHVTVQPHAEGGPCACPHLSGRRPLQSGATASQAQRQRAPAPHPGRPACTPAGCQADVSHSAQAAACRDVASC